MALPLLFAAGASALQGVSTIFGGFAQSRANKAKAQAAEIEARMARLQGLQIGEQSREALAGALGNIAVITSARGVSNDDPTGRVIERRTIQDAYRDEAVAVLAARNRASNAQLEARGYRSASRWSVPLAVMNSASSFANAYSYGSMAGKA